MRLLLSSPVVRMIVMELLIAVLIFTGIGALAQAFGADTRDDDAPTGLSRP